MAEDLATKSTFSKSKIILGNIIDSILIRKDKLLTSLRSIKELSNLLAILILFIVLYICIYYSIEYLFMI